MKLTQFNRKVMTNGGDSTKFTAEMNAAFFAVASDTMYQYKIAAIIREIVCNAYDSHLEAGNEDEPFSVVLPNDFNPNLTVEDYGVGLDDEGVRTVFASYFKSTKNNSEKQTGGFGIGAKSIFSYSATFEVVARKDGIERVYVCFIGEEGIPEVQIFSEKPTDHRNGVRVKIPVQKQDFNRFNAEAEVILSFFPTTPVVTGGLGVFEPMKTDLHEEIAEHGFARIKSHTGSDLYSGHMVYALVNNVLYPIPSSVYRELDNAPFIDILRNQKSLVLKFEDGELPPAAPRESLSLNEQTKGFIQEALNAILEVKRSEYQEKVDQFTHPRDALKYVNDEFGFSGKRTFTYKGKPVAYYQTRNYSIPKHELHVVVGSSKGPKRKHRPSGVSFHDLTRYDNYIIVYRENGVKETPIKTHVSRYIKKENLQAFSTMFIILDGCPANRPERVNALLNINAKIIDNQTLKEDVKSTRISAGITYYQGNKTDTTVFAKVINNNGAVQPIQNVDVASGEFLSIPSHFADCKLAKPAAFSEDLRFIVSNGNNEKKLARLGIRSYVDYAEQWIKENPEFVKLIEYATAYDNRGFRSESSYYDDVLSTSTADDIVKCRKEHKKYKELVGKFTYFASCTVLKSIAHPKIKTNYREKVVPVIERIDKDYGITKNIFSSDETVLLIRMIDFCNKNGFNVETEKSKIKEKKNGAV